MNTVTLLEMGDLDAFAEHLARQASQSGRGGLPIFNPFPAGHAWDPARIRAHRKTQWETAIGEQGWGRAFGAWDDQSLVGHIEIEGYGIEAKRHRMQLGMGVERAYHRRGLGTRLLSACIDWCMAEPQFAWLDLCVFGHNEAALRLYFAAGFLEVGRVEDRFRVDGQSIADAQLVLSLDARRAHHSLSSRGTSG